MSEKKAFFLSGVMILIIVPILLLFCGFLLTKEVGKIQNYVRAERLK